MSKVDYCNVVLAGLPQRELDRVQSVVNDKRLPACQQTLATSQVRPRNTAADGPSLATCAWACEVQAVRAHVPLPYWSGAAIFDRAGSACRQYCSSSSALGVICSSADLVVPSTRRSTIGDRAFAVAGPRAWNSLPYDIRTSTQSFDTFKKHLKSYLFQLSFSSL